MDLVPTELLDMFLKCLIGKVPHPIHCHVIIRTGIKISRSKGRGH